MIRRFLPHRARGLLFATAVAALTCAGGAAGAQRAYPNPAMPRVSGTPTPMDPSWAFASDPLFEDPMWSNAAEDSLPAPSPLAADPEEAARLAASMQRQMTALRRMGSPDALFDADPTWGILSFDTSPAGQSGMTGMGGPEADSNGCASPPPATLSGSTNPRGPAGPADPCIPAPPPTFRLEHPN